MPDVIGGFWTRESVLRYGENPHQRAALYLPGAPGDERSGPAGIAGAEQLHGKEMSYNNYVDTDAASRVARRAGRLANVTANMRVRYTPLTAYEVSNERPIVGPHQRTEPERESQP